MKARSLAFSLLLGAAFACDEPASSNATDAGGAAGTAAGEDVTCPSGTHQAEFVGVAEDATSGCVDTERMRLVPACENETPAGPFVCLQSASGGTKYWIFRYFEVTPANSEWELCSAAVGAGPPQPCYTTDCAEAPFVTTCGLEAHLASDYCGGVNSSLDDHCCLRPLCSSESDCAATEDCREYPSDSFLGLACGVPLDGGALDSRACSCTGSADGPPVKRCRPM